jgi:hypothetical protein
MNIIHRIHHPLGILAATAVLGLAAASPAMAETVRVPIYGPSVPRSLPPSSRPRSTA